MVRDPFDEFFRRMMKQFFRDLEEMEKEIKGLEEKFPKFDIKGPSRTEKSGFSIFLSSNGTHPPKIEMRRFGPSGKWEKVPLEKEKIAPKVKTPREMLKVTAKVPEKAALSEVKEKVIPDYDVSVDIKGVTITVNAKGVENRNNVKLKFYPESVEIYAVAPKLNRGYFCTVTVPASIDRGATAVSIEKERIIVKIPRKFPLVR